jgi:hypothetical protein
MKGYLSKPQTCERSKFPTVISALFPVVYKRKVKVKFTLEQAMKAQRGSRGIALLFL